MSLKHIESFYPLSPMQQGMLFHTLYAPESGAYFEQITCTLRGELNEPAFEHAWQRAVAHNPILRTAFAWEDLDEPVQVVHRQVSVPMERHDLRELAPEEQSARMSAYLQEQRSGGFDLATPPLLRLALFRLDQQTYRLIWSFHHLLLDGWSLPLILRDVFAAYEALRQGRDPRLPQRRPYRDYIVWLRRQDLSSAEAFWRRTLQGFTAPTALGVDMAAGADAKESYEEQHVELSRAATAELQAFARRHEVTLNTLVQGAWALLLSRYSGEEDLVFGVTVSGRPPDLVGSDQMAGLFINTLPVRVQAPGQITLADWLRQLHATQNELRQYEYSPLIQVHGWSEVPKRLPLFESILVFENYPLDSLSSERGGSLTILDANSVEQTNYPLTIVAVQDVALALRVSYDRRRFEPATIARMIDHLRATLEHMIADPQQRLADISILTDDERRQLLAGWSSAPADYPADRCAHELIAAQAARTPHATAVICQDARLTYQELNQRADQLARHLRTLGVGPEVRVAICMERSLDLIVGILGTLKAGGAYVPLDPAYPQEHLAFMLEDSRAAVLLTATTEDRGLKIEDSSVAAEGQLSSILNPLSSTRVVDLDADWDTIAAADAELPARTAQPDHLAYVIYTSGSTGRPKGVMIPHSALLNLACVFRDSLELAAGDRLLMIPSLSFDASVGDIFPPLICGATLVLHPAPSELAGHELRRFCEQQKISVIDIPAAFWSQWVRDLAANGDSDILPRLRLIIVGGESIANEQLRIWSELTAGRVTFFGPYGPTESTVCTTFYKLPGAQKPPANTAILPIGRPVANAQVYLLDRRLRPVPVGVPGEVYIGGAQLARGYLGRPELTAERFVPNPFSNSQQSAVSSQQSAIDEHLTGDWRLATATRLYRTGDLARYRPDGTLEFLGRADHQVKIRGYRIELGEIEAVLDQHPDVYESAVVVREDTPGDKRLIAYVVPRTEDRGLKIEDSSLVAEGKLSSILYPLSSELRGFLRGRLPEYMVPAIFMPLEAMPITSNGKVDRRALPAPEGLRPQIEAEYVAPRTEVEQRIAAVWQAVLQVDRVGIHDNFFDLGGHSMRMVQAHGQLRDQLGRDISLVELFKYPTVGTLARYLTGEQTDDAAIEQERLAERLKEGEQRLRQQLEQHVTRGPDGAAEQTGLEIAIIGMAGRFPGAADVDAYWRNLRDGIESVTYFSDQELLDAGLAPALLNNPNYVKASTLIDGIEQFDAAFFGYSPREAELMDPQQRLFLECAWNAIEGAGYNAEAYPGAIGVYAGVSLNTYWVNLYATPAFRAAAADFQTALNNDRDFLSTRVSYKLNLRGPSMTVQTACSTSLVAVYLAGQALLSGTCDMALAGGVALRVPQKSGYLYQEGGITSPDGHCRAFDAQGQGTIFGSGMGLVVLKRLADAIADGDQIYAVIKGSAINNDGSAKVGYTAPSVDGQAKVIQAAQLMAKVPPETISYVETHGTATALGDPIEIAALTQAFRAGTDKRAFCAIGSVKSNIGHLDTAAGIAGLIKTSLALQHRQLPPSLHYSAPNPKIDFANSPFYVNTALADWAANGAPRRAGISSFGIGGTNAHVILEEAPALADSDAAQPWQLLVLSARTSAALEAATDRLAQHLRRHPDLNLADIAYTLQDGRKAFDQRRALICRDAEDALAALTARDPRQVLTSQQEPADQPVVFLFPGQGTQYVNMGLELYQTEPVFRETVDRCAEILAPHLGLDIREILYPTDDDKVTRRQGDKVLSAEDPLTPSPPHPLTLSGELDQTQYTQPALFTIEYAMARLWMSWGVRPQAMIGHSIGEYVAACLAGVFALEDALKLVALRGRLIQELPAGAMLSVPLPEGEIQPLLSDELALAAVNGPELCVVSGPAEAVEELRRRLDERGVETRRLHTSHAFHSAMMDPIIDQFAEQVRGVALQPPAIPYISNVTGAWATADEATDPRYWARHLRQAVRFADGIAELLKAPGQVLLEVGPGRTLSTFARRSPAMPAGRLVLTSLRHPQEQQPDRAFALRTLGQLWIAGVPVDWRSLHAGSRRRRLRLPTYPFERQRYWLEGQPAATAFAEETESRPATLHKRPDIGEWFYFPAWQAAPPLLPATKAIEPQQRWLVFDDAEGLGGRMARRLEQCGQAAITVMAGKQFAQLDDHAYTIDPRRRADYDALLAALGDRDALPRTIVYLWNVASGEGAPSGVEAFEAALGRGFSSLVFLAQALGRHRDQQFQLAVISSNMQDVSGEATPRPEQALLLGPCKVIPQEYPQIACRSIDIVPSAPGSWQEQRLLDHLIAEIEAQPDERVVAYRGGQRWTQVFQPIRLPAATETIESTEKQNGSTPSVAKIGLRPGGVYLITGGLGGIGPVLARALAEAVRARLALVEGATFPERDEWDYWLATHDDRDATSFKLRTIRALEERGSEVLVLRADVTNLEQIEAALDQVHQRFGNLHGVIYSENALGATPPRALDDLVPTEYDSYFQSKVHGLYALEAALHDQQLDFCLLQSSLAAILGGPGLVFYATANLFLDAFARRHNQDHPVPWVSVNWDGWKLQEDLPAARGLPGLDLALTPDEGVEAFRRMLSAAILPQIVVSTGDLRLRMEQWLKREAPRGGSATQGDGQSLYPRPHLLTEYVAPSNEVERQVVEVWQEALGVEQIGIHDNFFELGGHSLMATQLIARLSDRFQVDIPLPSLFETATVAGVAEVIAQKLIEQVGDDLLAELAGLSQDEIQTMLMAENLTNGQGDINE